MVSRQRWWPSVCRHSFCFAIEEHKSRRNTKASAFVCEDNIPWSESIATISNDWRIYFYTKYLIFAMQCSWYAFGQRLIAAWLLDCWQVDTKFNKKKQHIYSTLWSSNILRNDKRDEMFTWHSENELFKCELKILEMHTKNIKCEFMNWMSSNIESKLKMEAMERKKWKV